ncbi:MAG: polysaccharide deacetylase family protein [Saprospiraceae bacterium]|nr:polysaccharide deacetylase family protein [Pyrinomonadaceae bacterium]
MTYHRFSETENPFAVSRSQFAAHLAYLSKFRTILSFAKIYECLRNNEKLPENTALITIDDGYRDAYEIAFPLIKKFNVPATLFGVTDFIEQEIWVWTDKMRFIASKMKEENSTIEIANDKIELRNSTPEQVYWTASKVNSILKKMPDMEKELEIARIAKELNVDMPDLPPETNSAITWDQAKEMDKNGLNIESHTVTHPILTNVDETRLNFELRESKLKLEGELQRGINAFCYPAGAVDKKVWQAAKQNGYEGAVTTGYGFNEKGSNPFLLNRIDALPDPVYFAQSSSGFEDFKLKFRK